MEKDVYAAAVTHSEQCFLVRSEYFSEAAKHFVYQLEEHSAWEVLSPGSHCWPQKALHWHRSLRLGSAGKYDSG